MAIVMHALTTCHVSDAVTEVHYHQLPTAIAESFLATCNSTLVKRIGLLLITGVPVLWLPSVRLTSSTILSRTAHLVRLSALVQTLS